MAKEYIEREAALEICKTEYQNRLRMLDYCGDTVAWNIGSEIKAIPAADVAPVVHGMWVYAKTYYDIDECNCSLCGQLMTTAIDKRMNYCPNCGAKMDGGAKDAAD